MIIVNQDRTIMLNFDNVDNIKVEKLPMNETGYKIVIETNYNYLDRFALYDTEERAKEVLQEIIKRYKTTLYNSKTNEVAVNIPKVYEMPEQMEANCYKVGGEDE